MTTSAEVWDSARQVAPAEPDTFWLLETRAVADPDEPTDAEDELETLTDELAADEALDDLADERTVDRPRAEALAPPVLTDADEETSDPLLALDRLSWSAASAAACSARRRASSRRCATRGMTGT